MLWIKCLLFSFRRRTTDSASPGLHFGLVGRAAGDPSVAKGVGDKGAGVAVVDREVAARCGTRGYTRSRPRWGHRGARLQAHPGLHDGRARRHARSLLQLLRVHVHRVSVLDALAWRVDIVHQNVVFITGLIRELLQDPRILGGRRVDNDRQGLSL